MNLQLLTSWNDADWGLSLDLVALAKEPPQLNMANLRTVKLNNFQRVTVAGISITKHSAWAFAKVS